MTVIPTLHTAQESRITPPACVVAAVSFLNTRPLIEGLGDEPGWRLVRGVPAALPEWIDQQHVDVALLPVVDFHRRCERLRIVSDACIASDGETLTVRVFSRAPAERVTRLRADPDSHTSVVLARLIWLAMYGVRLELLPARQGTVPPAGAEDADHDDAVLLIGDKVVTQRPRGFGFEVDLGAAWKHLTGLPMVFAVWTCRRGDWSAAQVEAVSRRLSAARDLGLRRVAERSSAWAGEHGWPAALALHYLTRSLCYRLDGRQRAGLERFLQDAERHGIMTT